MCDAVVWNVHADVGMLVTGAAKYEAQHTTDAARRGDGDVDGAVGDGGDDPGLRTGRRGGLWYGVPVPGACLRRRRQRTWPNVGARNPVRRSVDHGCPALRSSTRRATPSMVAEDAEIDDDVGTVSATDPDEGDERELRHHGWERGERLRHRRGDWRDHGGGAALDHEAEDELHPDGCRPMTETARRTLVTVTITVSRRGGGRAAVAPGNLGVTLYVGNVHADVGM